MGRPMLELTDRRYPLDDLLGHEVVGGLRQTLSGLRTIDARFAAVAEFVERMNGPAPIDEAAVAQSVRCLAETRGRVRAEELAAACKLSLRTLERRFGNVVGVSPRTHPGQHLLGPQPLRRFAR